MFTVAKQLVTTLSRQTKDNTVARAFAILRAVASDPQICASLRSAGFTEKDIERGWLLLRAVSGARMPVVTIAANPVASAMDELAAWNGPGFLRARAALRHLHPEQDTFVFQGLAAAQGPEAVLVVGTFLDRCAALESGKDRKASHKADVAALATLETRGVTKAERKRLRELVNLVETQSAPLPEISATPSDEGDAHMLELRAWVLDWSDTARAVIKRRDQLIRLGIGKRRAKKAVAPVPPPVVMPTPPAPPVIATPAPTAPQLATTSHDDDVLAPESRAA